MKPDFVTFTGIDDRTDLDRVRDLSSRYPIEWGILFGGSLLNGQRYPKMETVKRVMQLVRDVEAEGAGQEGGVIVIRLSAHLCGFFSHRAMNQGITLGEMDLILGGDRFKRIQVNARNYDVTALLRLREALQRPIIIQVRGNTFPELVEGLYTLHDMSGGKGRVPTSRPVQHPHMPIVGHSGGIGPANVLETLDSIEGHKIWLDMETNIRTDDWLDLDKCEAVCKLIWES